MSNLKLLLSFIALFTISKSSSQVPNRSFESGGADYADGWTWSGTGTVRRVQHSIVLGDTIVALDGKYFMEFTNSPSGKFCTKFKALSANAGRNQWLAVYYRKPALIIPPIITWELRTYSYESGSPQLLFNTNLGGMTGHNNDSNYRPIWLQQFGGRLTSFDPREDSTEFCLYIDTVNIMHPESILLLDDVYLPYASVSVPSIDDLNFAVYPNPIKSANTIKLVGLTHAYYHYKMYDMKGQLMAQGQTEFKDFGHEVSLKQPLPDGIYLMQIEDSSGKTGRVKIIVND